MYVGSTVDVFVNEDNVFTGLFYQDKLMKFSFQHYPEVLMVDSTYKLNDLNGNGEGSSCIVSYFFGD